MFQRLSLDTLAEVAFRLVCRRCSTPSLTSRWLARSDLSRRGGRCTKAPNDYTSTGRRVLPTVRIKELTGLSLADGQDRLALHLGLDLGQLVGAIDTPIVTGGEGSPRIPPGP